MNSKTPPPQATASTQPESLHHVYDRFYKFLFSNKVLLEEFFTLFFPEVSRHIDFKKGRQLKSSFIKSDYTDREADVIYSVPLAGKETYIYILIEHQSQPDKKIFLRLLEYQLALWNEIIHQENAKPLALPPIIPVVVYNGAASWRIPTTFRKSFLHAPKDLIKMTPEFRYLLFDLHKIPESVLLEGPELIKKPLLLDKHRRHIDSKIKLFLEQVSNSKADKKALKELLRAAYYFILYHTKMHPEQLELEIEENLIEEALKEEFMQVKKSAALQLIERGLEQGLEQGKIEMAEKLLQENADVAFVVRITGLSEEAVLKLKAK